MHPPANTRLHRDSAIMLDSLPVVMLHGTGNSGGMWRRVAEALPTAYPIFTPDLVGYGSSPAWPTDMTFSIADEVRAITLTLPNRCDSFHLLGYSYGGGIALGWALAEPQRVRSLTLIEPIFPRALAYA